MPLSASALSVASVEGGSARVTAMVYVLVVVVSSAVTFMVMMFTPTVSDIVPSASVTPPILMT